MLLLAPARTWAETRELDFRGQKISVEGLNEGDWFYLKGEPNSGEEELVLVYTNANPSVIKSFTAPYNIEARMLLVVVGGAGGYGTTGPSNPGGGGGGGEVIKLEENCQRRGKSAPFALVGKELHFKLDCGIIVISMVREMRGVVC